MKNEVTIKIPGRFSTRLSQMVAGTGFPSVTEFIVFAMRTLASGGQIREEHRQSIDIEILRPS